MYRIILFTQPGCLSCEITRAFLDAREMTYEERDISKDDAAHREMIDRYDCRETPALVIFSGEEAQVYSDLDPETLDQLLVAVSSSHEG